MAWDKNYIQELKLDDYTAPMIEDVEEYKIRILHRGEQLFYWDKKKNRAFISEIQIRNGSIYSNSIKKWDDTGEKITSGQKAIIIERLKSYFINYQKLEPIIR
ncbi:hypothetical protein [Flagellimonas sp. 2504JD4-2]